MINPKDSIRFADLTKTLSVKNIGSFRKLKPRSTDCCSLYFKRISSEVNSSLFKTLVAKMNRPALRFATVTFSSQIATVASILYLNDSGAFDCTILILKSVSSWYLDFFNRRDAAF